MGTAQPNWDLDQYILNYRGHGKIHRLRFVALKCPALQADALTSAIRLIKETTLDVALYQETVEKLHQFLPSAEEATLDKAWIENASRTAKATTERLEAELKNYKNNLIKESIRVHVPCANEILTLTDGTHGLGRTLLPLR
jgi:COP9 signalosome complex subunit 1